MDLYPKPNWTFVFGWSRIKKRVGIFSFARYDPNFENHTNPEVSLEDYKREKIDDKDSEIQKLILHRACKTMTHEIWHMFGMRHCIVHECLMNGTNKLQEGDLKPFLLWPVWLRKLQFAIGFDITRRFRGIKEVLETEFKSNHYFKGHLEILNYILNNCIPDVQETKVEEGYETFNKKLLKYEDSSSGEENQNMVEAQAQKRPKKKRKILKSKYWEWPCKWVIF